jgi:nitroreductase
VIRDDGKEGLSSLIHERSMSFPRGVRVLLRLASQIIASAPVVIAIMNTGELSREMLREDEEHRGIGDFFRLMEIQSASAAVQNLMLAATSLGLGTVWLGAVCLLKDEIIAYLGQTGDLMAVVPVGYASGSPPGSPRKKPLGEVARF